MQVFVITLIKQKPVFFAVIVGEFFCLTKLCQDIFKKIQFFTF